jgi:hypothetical protein
VKRSDLVETLARHLPGGCIRFGCKVEAISLDPITRHPIVSTSNGSTIRAKVHSNMIDQAKQLYKQTSYAFVISTGVNRLRWSKLSGGEVLGSEAGEILASVGGTGLDYHSQRPQLQGHLSRVSRRGYDLPAHTYE